MRLEPVRELLVHLVRELLAELLLSLLQAGQECRPLYADLLGDGLVGESFLAEFADAACFRHELVQTVKKLAEHHLIGEDLLDEWSVVRHVVAESSFAVRQWIVKGDGRVVVELAVEAVPVAQPPFAARAEALAAILHPLPECGSPAVVLAVLVLRDLVPGASSFVIDAFTLVVIVFHVRYLRSLLPNRRPHKKEGVAGQTEQEFNSFRSASHARRLVTYSLVTAKAVRATSVHRGERI